MTKERADHSDRNKQFLSINGIANQFLTKDNPVISINRKKRAPVNSFKNARKVWTATAMVFFCAFGLPCFGQDLVPEEINSPKKLPPQTETTPPDEVKGLMEADQKGSHEITSMMIRDRTNYIVTGQYSNFDLLLPGKTGFSIGVIKSEDITVEFEYMTASVAVPFIVQDLGSFKEQRFSLVRRNYLGSNSFNFAWGISYITMDLKLGNNIVSKIAPTMPYLDLLEIDTIGPMASVGNRWSFDSGVMLGVDWFGWAQPLFVVKKRLNSLITYSESNRDAIDKATKTLTYFPRLHALKLQLGYQW